MAQTQGMKLGVLFMMVEGAMQGKTPTFRDTQATALAAEQIGLDSFWLADHLIYRFPDSGERGCWEVMTMLSAVASTTTRIALGPLVACTSFRSPTLLAKMADSLDEISSGRFILGLGAGWHEPEYKAFGYPFDHRVSRFAEALQIIVPLLREGKVDFQGQYYEARDCVLRPRGPSSAGPQILIGSHGPRMLQLVARYADAWNTAWHLDAAAVKEQYDGLLEACKAVGRDPSTIELTAGTRINLQQPGEVEDQGRAISGSPEEIAQQLRAFADVGVRHLVMQIEPSGVIGLERFQRVLELFRQE